MNQYTEDDMTQDPEFEKWYEEGRDTVYPYPIVKEVAKAAFRAGRLMQMEKDAALFDDSPHAEMFRRDVAATIRSQKP